ncbi:MAG: hypothetical protein LBF24_01755 [Puniceicoccales bacterium]|jgi:hypothetical protein|nr:hypothetical protein [Puniceicoccales bacterium]
MGALPLMTGAFAWTWDVSLSRSTKDVVTGSKFGQEKEEISLTAVHNSIHGALFCSASARLMEGASGSNRLSTGIGYQRGIVGICHIGIDYQANFYFRSKDRRQDSDVHGTIRLGGDFSLGADAIYNFNRQDINVWLSTTQLGELVPIGLNFLYLRSSLSFGYDRCRRPGEEVNFFRAADSEKPHGFFYYVWGWDLILQRGTAPALLSLGVRYAGNTAPKTNWNNRNGGHRHLLWMVMGTTFQF